mmetsp:Transcript_34231/g.78908  ORF Transcript_34231/g.78908 Transcript_34231/m.78908 type:complete len:181 (+) Transcript_34231:383-925(+)
MRLNPSGIVTPHFAAFRADKLECFAATCKGTPVALLPSVRPQSAFENEAAATERLWLLLSAKTAEEAECCNSILADNLVACFSWLDECVQGPDALLKTLGEKSVPGVLLLRRTMLNDRFVWTSWSYHVYCTLTGEFIAIDSEGMYTLNAENQFDHLEIIVDDFAFEAYRICTGLVRRAAH